MISNAILCIGHPHSRKYAPPRIALQAVASQHREVVFSVRRRVEQVSCSQRDEWQAINTRFATPLDHCDFVTTGCTSPLSCPRPDRTK